MTATERKYEATTALPATASRADRKAAALRYAGAKEARFNRVTGTLIVIVDLQHGGDWLASPEEEDARWALMCDDHSTLLTTATRPLARLHASVPEWCPDCQALMASGKQVAGAPPRRRKHDAEEEIEDDDYFAALRDNLRGE